MSAETISITHSPVLSANQRFSMNLDEAEGGGAEQARIGTFLDYNQKIRAQGGYWRAEFNMIHTLPILAEMFENGWMRHVVASGSRAMPCFEGFIGGMELNLEGAIPFLHVMVYGYYSTLFMRVYNQTVVTTDTDAYLEVANIIAAVGQFIASTSRQVNVTQINRLNDADRWAGDLLFDIAEVGDAAEHRWIIGCYDNRQLVYEEIAKYEIL